MEEGLDILDSPILLLLLSVLPGLIYVSIYYNMDKHRKEPLGVVLRAFFWGAFAVVPIGLFQSLIPDMGFSSNFLSYAFYMILVVGCTEELGKWLVIRYYAFRNTAFDEVTDGIVYGISAAGGFAIFENIFYVFDHGFETGILRSVLSVPGHLFWGAISGYWIAMYKFAGASRSTMLWKGLGVASISHGLFNTSLNFEWSIVLAPVIIVTNGLMVRKFFQKTLEHDRVHIHSIEHSYTLREAIQENQDGSLGFQIEEKESIRLDRDGSWLGSLLRIGTRLLGIVFLVTGGLGILGMGISAMESDFADEDLYASVLLMVWVSLGLYLIFKSRNPLASASQTESPGFGERRSQTHYPPRSEDPPR